LQINELPQVIGLTLGHEHGAKDTRAKPPMGLHDRDHRPAHVRVGDPASVS
jgi:hypothetical protein